MRSRCTVSKVSERLVGTGLHGGQESWIQLHPTDRSGRGIIFRSHATGAEVLATAGNVVSTNRSTCLGTDVIRVETVEHLLSALYSAGITDVDIVFDGVELPICDGSSLPFVALIESAGVHKISGTFDDLSIDKEIVVSDGHGSVITAVPSEQFWMTVVLDYAKYPAIGTLAASYNGTSYDSMVAPARTYGFHHELDALKAAGLGQGASFDNVIALESDGSPDPRTPLRMADELVRHKILDMIGDLSLIQKNFKFGVVALRPSHSLNVCLSKALLGLEEKTGVL